MNTFQATFSKISKRQKLSYNKQHTLNVKVQQLNLKRKRHEILSDSEDDNDSQKQTKISDLTSELLPNSDNAVELFKLPEWDLSSIDDSDDDITPPLETSSDCCEELVHVDNEAPPLHPCCNISKEESIYGILRLQQKHNLTKRCTEDILKLFSRHVPTDVNYPRSYHNLMKEVALESNWFQKVPYCPSCELILDVELKCPSCLSLYNAPARAMLQGHKQFNGKHGCNWCRNPGISIEKGRGHCRVYEMSKSTGWKLRESEVYAQNAKNGKFKKGQKLEH
ncbi:hypothetical protein Fcan01_25756 [Folsomia candida]|uniref:Uncharacterized protein n=1 Tax=Folsomia candida TaxID=158441 RepID=A0A226D1Y3_FOLCA|nr:hypothetical protein Fcan01_25756 [Folsomia candida]